MPREPRSALSERACLQCQKRKTKCVGSKEGRPCSYCSRSGRDCVFTEPQLRTPLTRQNLDEAEARCKRLEALLRRTQPDANLEGTIEDGDSSKAAAAPPPNPIASPILVAPSTSPYEWSETFDVPQDGRVQGSRKGPDGMASSAGRGEDAGYLGYSSGHGILESVSELLPSDADLNVTLPTTDRAGQSDHVEMFGSQGSILNNKFSASLVRENLVNAYFLAYNSSYPILHEATFRRQCEARSRISSSSSWHILYYVVLAIGEWVSGYCNEEHSLYYEAARSRLNIAILESGNMTNVQTFLLIGNYLQKRDRPNTGYNYVGIAYRMALGLGLHREITAVTELEHFVMHRRRVLFWTLYCFDCGFSITTGRPTLAADAFIDVHVPANIDETLNTSSSGVSTEVSYPTSCSALIAQARLTRIASKIYNQFMCIQPGTDLDHQTTVMEQMIQNWRDSLPSYFFQGNVPQWFLGPRQIVLWKEANLRILLLLANQRHHTDSHEKHAIGVRYRGVAAQTIHEITYFCNHQIEVVHVGLSWYAVYFILQAVLALSVQHISRNSLCNLTIADRESDLATYEQTAQQAQECFQSLSSNSKAAVRSLQILSRLRESARKSSLGSKWQTRSDAGSARTNSADVLARPSTSLSQEANPTSGSTAISNDYLAPRTDEVQMNTMNNEWGTAADPALHALFYGADSISDVFQGVQGFPSSIELDDFSYLTSSMLTAQCSPYGTAEDIWGRDSLLK